MKLHELKIKSEYYIDVRNGQKTFELRKNDRDYEEGDLITFNCIDSANNPKDGALYKITYILKDVPQYGLDADYCILGIKRVKLEEV